MSARLNPCYKVRNGTIISKSAARVLHRVGGMDCHDTPAPLIAPNEEALKASLG